MGLWRKFIKPRKPYKLRLDKRRLRISQALLGGRPGPCNSDYVVQCAIGSNPPFTICTLRDECCWYGLNLEFEDREDVVFSVDGPCGVYLVGRYIPFRATSSGTSATDELQVDFWGQDISNQDTDMMTEYIASDGAAMKGQKLDLGRQLYQKINQEREVPNTYTDRSNEKNVPVIVSTEQDSCPTNKKSRASKISTLSHGMIVEVLEEGNQDGKEASWGKQIEILFSAKLCASGLDLGSNINEDAPEQIRLGHTKLAKGVNIGIEGMRVGEKRRLIIPPSLSCGSKRKAEFGIDPDEWMQYDVELVGVCD